MKARLTEKRLETGNIPVEELSNALVHGATSSWFYRSDKNEVRYSHEKLVDQTILQLEEDGLAELIDIRGVKGKANLSFSKGARKEREKTTQEMELVRFAGGKAQLDFVLAHPLVRANDAPNPKETLGKWVQTLREVATPEHPFPNQDNKLRNRHLIMAMGKANSAYLDSYYRKGTDEDRASAIDAAERAFYEELERLNVIDRELSMAAHSQVAANLNEPEAQNAKKTTAEEFSDKKKTQPPVKVELRDVMEQFDVLFKAGDLEWSFRKGLKSKSLSHGEQKEYLESAIKKLHGGNKTTEPLTVSQLKEAMKQATRAAVKAGRKENPKQCYQQAFSEYFQEREMLVDRREKERSDGVREKRTTFAKVASTGVGLMAFGAAIKAFFLGEKDPETGKRNSPGALKIALGLATTVALAAGVYHFGWRDRVVDSSSASKSASLGV